MKIFILFLILLLAVLIAIISPDLAGKYFLESIFYIINYFQLHVHISHLALFVTCIGIIVALISLRYNQQVSVFNMTSSNYDASIRLLESLYEKGMKVNDSDSWDAVAAQLDAFHNLAITKIKNKVLRQAYCVKLYLYHHRLSTILNIADNYLFYYGLDEYTEMTPEQIRTQSFEKNAGVSTYSLGTILSFMSLIGPKRAGKFDNNEVNQVFQPLTSLQFMSSLRDESSFNNVNINEISLPYRNIYLYGWHYLHNNLPSNVSQ